MYLPHWHLPFSSSNMEVFNLLSTFNDIKGCIREESFLTPEVMDDHGGQKVEYKCAIQKIPFPIFCS